eukprot:g4519.t1
MEQSLLHHMYANEHEGVIVEEDHEEEEEGRGKEAQEVVNPLVATGRGVSLSTAPAVISQSSLPIQNPRKKFLSPRHSNSRLLDRDSHFSQSSGHLNMSKSGISLSLYAADWFHSLANKRIETIATFIAILYLILNVLFSFAWYSCSEVCNVGIVTWNEAFLFALTTMTTIGYGSQDPLFANCFHATVIVFLESMGVTYTKFSRGTKRAQTIVFSDRSVLRFIDGRLYFQFQVVEMRKHQLVEGHVRCYAIRDVENVNGKKTFFQQHMMRLQHPDDELGGCLLLALPSVVVHRLDPWSPFVPPVWWMRRFLLRHIARERGRSVKDAALATTKYLNWIQKKKKMEEKSQHNAMKSYRFPSVLQRSDDADAGMRSVVVCTVCGESFETQNQLRLHKAYCAIDDRISGHDLATCNPCTGESFSSLRCKQANIENLSESSEMKTNSIGTQAEHSSINHLSIVEKDEEKETFSIITEDEIMQCFEGDNFPPHLQPICQAMISEFITESKLEVVVLVEGIDPITSASLQCRHSYVSSSEICWNKTFAQCVSRKENMCHIDFEKFHQLDEVNDGMPPPPPVSHS